MTDSTYGEGRWELAADSVLAVLVCGGVFAMSYVAAQVAASPVERLSTVLVGLPVIFLLGVLGASAATSIAGLVVVPVLALRSARSSEHPTATTSRSYLLVVTATAAAAALLHGGVVSWGWRQVATLYDDGGNQGFVSDPRLLATGILPALALVAVGASSRSEHITLRLGPLRGATLLAWASSSAGCAASLLALAVGPTLTMHMQVPSSDDVLWTLASVGANSALWMVISGVALSVVLRLPRSARGT